MILSDLLSLYELKQESDPGAIPKRFWCTKNVSWEVIISESGKALTCISLATDDGKSYQRLEVPDVQRTSGVRPFFLCDNVEYVFGADPKRGESKHEKFVECHREILEQVDDSSATAFLSFLDSIQAGVIPPELQSLDDGAKGLVVFRIAGDTLRVHERPKVQEAWEKHCLNSGGVLGEGRCLVTGKPGAYAKLFPQVTGLPGAQSSGASLVSCNVEAFSSYGQKLSTAGAITQETADKAGAALVYVLKDPNHNVRIGNDYIAFWTESKNPIADASLAFWLDLADTHAEDLGIVPDEDEDVRGAVMSALVQLRSGKSLAEIPQGATYHLLGVAPYQARLAVRFYETGTLGELQKNVVQYLKDTELQGASPRALSSYLRQTAVQGEMKNVPSTLLTSCMRAMVHNTPFPSVLLQKLLERMRSDHGNGKPWDMADRAAIMKACLLRAARAKGVEQGLEAERSLTVGLNEENRNQGYLLGRLFAMLEKAQLDAIGRANATIRDRYMSAAATTPARVFPQLLKLSQYHISKSDFGNIADRNIQRVIACIGDEGFPKTLAYNDQGMFYIGYYQQREELYRSKADKEHAKQETEGK